MNFLSLASGIEAASVAFKPLGWKAIGFSEIDPFASAVLAHHYPEVPNFGDMTCFREWPEEAFAEADIVVGGPPCQAFSVAGMRAGLNDARGNLTLTYAELIDHADDVRLRRGKKPVLALYENVPGILSDKTNAFGCLLAALAGEDEPIVVKKWPRAGVVDGRRRRVAWCILDAQYFGLAQRRRRVFVLAVPCELIERLGERADPAEILSIGRCLRGDTPSREIAREVAPTIPSRSLGGGGLGTDFDCDGGLIESFSIQAGALRTNPASGPDGAGVQEGYAYTLEALAEVQAVCVTGDITHTLKAEGFDASEDGTGRGRGRGQPIVAFDTTQITSAENRSNPQPGDPCHPLAAGAHPPAIAFQERGRGDGTSLEIGGEVAYALTAPSGGGRAQERNILTPLSQVRRLTPRECERLQGFPDDWTLIPYRNKPASQCPAGPRYKALGNSWAVPCVQWIGRRIHSAILSTERPAP